MVEVVKHIKCYCYIIRDISPRCITFSVGDLCWVNKIIICYNCVVIVFVLKLNFLLFEIVFVIGKNLVPIPAIGNTAILIFLLCLIYIILKSSIKNCGIFLFSQTFKETLPITSNSLFSSITRRILFSKLNIMPCGDVKTYN